jgi:hypothetical protein
MDIIKALDKIGETAIKGVGTGIAVLLFLFVFAMLAGFVLSIFFEFFGG